MTDSMLADSIATLLADQSTPAAVRAIEAGGAASALWQQIADSGFPDALVPENAGGAGLGLREVLPVFTACGRFALPLPLAQTMLARAFLAEAGRELPDGPITFALATRAGGGGPLACPSVPYGAVSEWVLAITPDEAWLLRVADGQVTPTGIHASLESRLDFAQLPPGTTRIPHDIDWLVPGAAAFAAQMAGAMERIFEMTLQHANDRVQFGRPIGRFQAIQQQVSVMAEYVAAARMAAEIGADTDTWIPAPLAAAIAKSRTSEAVPTVTATAHAVHGAIGITAEFDLQLFTRRLHEWRRAFGAETFWNERLGTAMLESGHDSTVAFIRDTLPGSA